MPDGYANVSFFLNLCVFILQFLCTVFVSRQKMGLTQPRSQTSLITCGCTADFEVAHSVVHGDARELVEDGKSNP